MKKGKRVFYLLLAALCAVTAVKILLAGYDKDEEYAVSMAYRFLKGDCLLTDMWEPHQTSGWLCALLMFPYTAVFHTTTGIFLYLRICGLLLHGGVGFCMYRTLSGFLEKERAFLISALWFFSLPKIMFLPEFSNLLSWCLMMAMLCLVRYYGVRSEVPGNHALRELALAGVFLALAVLAYPSAILAFVACVGSMIYARRRSPHPLLKELGVLCLPCVLGGVLFMALLFSYISPERLGGLISIVMSDGSHSAPWSQRFTEHGKSLAQLLLLFAIYGAAALIAEVFCQRKAKKAPSLVRWCGFLTGAALVGQVGIWLFMEKYPNYPMAEYFFLPFLFLCAVIRRKLPKIPAFGFLILMPLAAFAGVVLFSNHPLLVSAPFLAPCVAGILSLPQLAGREAPAGIRRHGAMLQGLLILWVCVLLFGRCYMQRTTGGRHETILDDMSLMRVGPGVGLIADTDGVKRYRYVYELIDRAIPENARVFYMGADTDVYLMKEMEYCTPSTICSPTFDEKVLYYFELHPEKAPEYVICDTGLLYTDPWVTNYIGEFCEEAPLEENNYIKIYRVRGN